MLNNAEFCVQLYWYHLGTEQMKVSGASTVEMKVFQVIQHTIHN